DGRSDMYASGIVLWELLTGRQLFPPGKDQPQDLLSRAKNPEPPRPSKRAPRVPVELDEICLKALAAAKADRYADCDAMRMALQSWLAHNAPTTDGTRMSQFLQDLFSDDISRERAERQEMISRVRTRALTMPPSDELRLMIEKSDKVSLEDLAKAEADAEAPVRKPGSVGRRASDRDEEGNDRRRESDRRLQTQPRTSTASRNDASAAMALKAEPDTAELDIGSEVDGRYKIVELIGEGGMGKVYLAEHVEIGKRVALKVLHASYSRMPDLVERFRREARAASKIGHPNIVDVTDSGSTADGSVYFVMEYLEGVELGSVIEREGALDVARALRITGQICRALSAAHREGIIHRDLKPENIFLITRGGEADVVKVLDFGIAKTTEAEAARERRLTSPGMAMGTPEYMAPEQAAGRPADARTDIYSLGAIMYEMCTGQPPYTGDNFMEILTKKATQDPPPPLTIRPELPALVGDLVQAAMSRNPDERPQSMDGLEYELNKCLAGRGVAVAQILGMTTDAAVVASLNSGLSMRNFDEGIVRSQPTRAGTASEVWDTRSGVSRSPGAGTNVRASSEPSGRTSSDRNTALARPATPLPTSSDSNPIASPMTPAQVIPAPSAPVDLKQRSGAATFAWVLFVLLLLGGGGVLAYTMLVANNDDEATRSPTSANPDVGSAAPVVPTKSETPIDKTHANPRNPHTQQLPAPHPVVGSGAVVHAATTNPPPAVEDNSPKGLVAQSQAAENEHDWAQVKTLNEKLEKFPKFAADAVYAQAWAAFQMNDTPKALALATRAAKLEGKNNSKAMLLYADTIYKQGDYKRAKDNYESLRVHADKEAKNMLAHKIASCNEKLGLADNDGIKD
ncbi:MAG TPA: protein kinase, partial [Kofleriaceae bacterium]